MMERLTSCDMYFPDVDKRLFYHKLKEYEDLEEQGLLLKLPCKIGDTVYRINFGAKEPIIKMRVVKIYITQSYENKTIFRFDAINNEDLGESCYVLEDIGKKIFLTQEDAEQKLKEMRNEYESNTNNSVG